MIRTDLLYSAAVALRLLVPLPPLRTIPMPNDLIRMPNVPTPMPNVKIPTRETPTRETLTPHEVINPNHHPNNPLVPPRHQEVTLMNP